MCMWPQVNASSVGSNPEQDHVGAPAAHTDPVMVWRAELKHTVCFSWEKLIIFKWFCLVYSQTYSFSRCICFGSFLSVPASKSKSLLSVLSGHLPLSASMQVFLGCYIILPLLSSESSMNSFLHE